MAPYLIATAFTYDMTDAAGRVKTERGSYLGRTRASVRTLRTFLRTNDRITGWGGRSRLREIQGSYTSPWIAK